MLNAAVVVNAWHPTLLADYTLNGNCFNFQCTSSDIYAQKTNITTTKVLNLGLEERQIGYPTAGCLN
jgi:hypothetical protein